MTLLPHHNVTMFTQPCHAAICKAVLSGEAKMKIRERRVMCICGLFQHQMLIVWHHQYHRGFLKQLLQQKASILRWDNSNPNGLFSIAALMLDYNKLRIKLQNSIAVDRN